MAAMSSFTPLMERVDAISNAPKQVIPSNDLKEILMNAEYMKELQPLIADVVLQASSIQGLMDDITTLFEKKKTTELTNALTVLQEKLQSIYKKTKGDNEENPNEANDENPNEAMDKITKIRAGGGGRRRTKNAYFYNKRRKTRRRKGKK